MEEELRYGVVDNTYKSCSGTILGFNDYGWKSGTHPSDNLRTIPGVGEQTAPVFLAVVGEKVETSHIALRLSVGSDPRDPCVALYCSDTQSFRLTSMALQVLIASLVLLAFRPALQKAPEH